MLQESRIIHSINQLSRSTTSMQNTQGSEHIVKAELLSPKLPRNQNWHYCLHLKKFRPRRLAEDLLLLAKMYERS